MEIVKNEQLQITASERGAEQQIFTSAISS